MVEKDRIKVTEQFINAFWHKYVVIFALRPAAACKSSEKTCTAHFACSDVVKVAGCCDAKRVISLVIDFSVSFNQYKRRNRIKSAKNCCQLLRISRTLMKVQTKSFYKSIIK